MSFANEPLRVNESIRTAEPVSKKPLRFKVGVALLILYPLTYLIIPIAPFLPIDAAAKVGIVAGVLAAAEAILLIGIACVGKEAYQSLKTRLRLGRKKSAAATDVESGSSGSSSTSDDAGQSGACRSSLSVSAGTRS